MLRPGHISSSVSATACLILAGCSGVTLPALPPASPQTAGAGSKAAIVGPPTDIYARIARGAMACWFGTAGPLKADYVYHASAEPPAKGGKAQIVIHKRDTLSKDPRGLRAFRISITPDDETSALLIENLKLPEPQAKAMEVDVRRWATGEIGCSKANAAGAWVPQATKSPAKRK